MTNKELQELLKKYPDSMPVFKYEPIQGDCENCREVEESDIYYDTRYPAIVLMA